VSRAVLGRAVATAVIVAMAAATSERADWQPVGLLLTLAIGTLVADAASVAARRIRLSAGLMVQTTAMALLGPAPAVAIGMLSTAVESRLNRVSPASAMNNLVVFSLLGLVGGVMFDALREGFDLSIDDTAYALLVLPGYLVLAGINLALVTTLHPNLPRAAWLPVIKESGVPAFPLEFVNGVLAVTIVLAWANAGLVVAAPLVMVLAVTIPLSRTLSDALTRSDDLIALRVVSDERAAEVARLASDRDRLLSEVLQAESRERARLAESLHDGPMQRLVALRQDAAEQGHDTAGVDATIAETRAIISAFHPATVRALGFEASLRAAIAPFPAARSIALTVQTTADDAHVDGSPLLPVAQELVVNAVKHASPSAIDVGVARRDGQLVLEVNDDGIGIDTEQAGRAVQAGHLGLAMVRRRVEDAGGSLEIETREDGGTRSRVTLPERRKAPG
jgi:signal transduction histidine kinase